MASIKSLLALMLVGMEMVVQAEPQLSNTYLPPDQGYNYDKPSISFPTPGKPTGPAPSGGGNHLGDGGDGHVHMPGMPYDFAYAVKDDFYGNDYSHNAVSDGDVVKGEYRVQLPDGRLQIVSYTADWKTGFHADVKYEGEAQYPEGPSPGQGPAPGKFPPGGGQGPAYIPPKSGY